MGEIHIPFDQGINQAIDPAVPQEGTLFRVVNGRIPREGGVAKRLGTDAVSTSLEPSGVTQAVGSGRPNGAARVQGRDILAVSERVYARDGETAPTWVEVGRSAQYLPRKVHFIGLDETSVLGYPPQVAAFGNYIAYAYEETETLPDASTVTYTVLEVFDASMVRRYTTKIPNRLRPRVFVAGTVFVLTYQTTTQFFSRTFDPATATLTAEPAAIALVGAADHYDAAPWTSTHFLQVSREATTVMRVRTINLAGTIVDTEDLVCVNSATQRVRVYGTSGEGIWVTWRDGAATVGRVAFVNATLTASAGPFDYGTSVSHFGFTRKNATEVWLAWQDLETGTSTTRAMYVDNTAGFSGFATIPSWNMTLASTPFSGDDNRFRCWIKTGAAPPSNSLYVLATLNRDGDPDFLNQWILDIELTSHYAASGTSPPSPVAQRGERWYFAAVDTIGNFASALQLYEFEDTTTRRGAARQIIEGAGAGFVVGGHLQEIPSDRINSSLDDDPRAPRGFSSNWVRTPTFDSGFPADIGGGALAAGTYAIAAVYEYIDVDGRRHQSAPLSTTVTVAANGQVRARVTSSERSERELSTDQVRGVVVIYMSAAPGGSTLYRVSTVARSAVDIDYAQIDIGVAPSTTAETIYTGGNVLQDFAPPSSRVGLLAHDALWLAGLWDPRMVERSKTIVPNVTARFTRADQFRAIAPFDAHAVAELDNQILVLGTAGLAVMGADGPNDQGNPALIAPSLLSSTGLASEAAALTVLRIPPGVLFHGKRGLYIVPRGGGEPEFLGSPIQTDAFTVLSVAESYEAADSNLPGSRLVGFLIQDAAGTKYIAQLDQDTLQWVSVDTCSSAIDLLGSWGNKVVQLPSNPSVALSIRSTGSARSADTQTIIETSWIRPFGLLGWGFVRRGQLLVTALSTGSQALLEVARDGGAYGPLTTLTPAATGLQALEFKFSGDQRCASVRFRVSDVAGAGEDPGGMIYHGISLDVDAEEGLARLSRSTRT